MFCDASTEPTLSPSDIDVLLQMSRRRDVNDHEPQAANWTPTYDVNYAIAQGWLVKAGRTSNRYLFMTGGKMLSRNQYYEHCLDLYRRYMGKASLGVKVLGPGELDLSALIPIANV